MQLKNLVKPHIPIALSLLMSSGCMPSKLNYCKIRDKNADHDKCKLLNNVDLPEHPLTLEEIIDISLDRNLDVQLQRLEEAFQSETAYAQKLRQLPEVTPNADINNRNNNPAWFSRTVNLPGGPGPVGPFATQSTSRFARLYDFTCAWNVIDFGLSWVRTRQEKNRFLLTRQRNLRARQNLVLDVYRAYYRAIVAKQAIEQANILIQGLERRQETLRRQVATQIVSEMQGLVNENRLIDLQIKLYAFDNEYKSAMTELAGLMGVPPGCKFELADMQVSDVEVDNVCMNELENMALRYRPELMAQDMQYVIDADEVKASMVELLPNARLFSSFWHDDDFLNYNSDWFKFGTTISWNLLHLPAKWKNKEALSIRQKVAWDTRLSMSMGVLTQVHLSHINVRESEIQFGLAKNLYGVKDRQLKVARVLERSGEMSTDDVMVFEVEALFARVNAVKAYSNLQISLEQLSNSIGRPLILSGGDQTAVAYGLENCCDYEGSPCFSLDIVRRSPSDLFSTPTQASEEIAPPVDTSIEGASLDETPSPEDAQQQMKDLEKYYDDFLNKQAEEDRESPPVPEEDKSSSPSANAFERASEEGKEDDNLHQINSYLKHQNQEMEKDAEFEEKLDSSHPAPPPPFDGPFSHTEHFRQRLNDLRGARKQLEEQVAEASPYGEQGEFEMDQDWGGNTEGAEDMDPGDFNAVDSDIPSEGILAESSPYGEQGEFEMDQDWGGNTEGAEDMDPSDFDAEDSMSPEDTLSPASFDSSSGILADLKEPKPLAAAPETDDSEEVDDEDLTPYPSSLTRHYRGNRYRKEEVAQTSGRREEAREVREGTQAPGGSTDSRSSITTDSIRRSRKPATSLQRERQREATNQLRTRLSNAKKESEQQAEVVYYEDYVDTQQDKYENKEDTQAAAPTRKEYQKKRRRPILNDSQPPEVSQKQRDRKLLSRQKRRHKVHDDNTAGGDRPNMYDRMDNKRREKNLQRRIREQEALHDDGNPRRRSRYSARRRGYDETIAEQTSQTGSNFYYYEDYLKEQEQQ